MNEVRIRFYIFQVECGKYIIEIDIRIVIELCNKYILQWNYA